MTDAWNTYSAAPSGPGAPKAAIETADNREDAARALFKRFPKLREARTWRASGADIRWIKRDRVMEGEV